MPSICSPRLSPTTIVPEPTYPPASGGYSATQVVFGHSGLHLDLRIRVGSNHSGDEYANERKAIQELFTLDYGRMNATLGTELPLTNFLTQTTIPFGYIDPPTEIINQGDTQLWKITHNGVDSHFIHFHLFNVQVINRVGWDGSLRPPRSERVGLEGHRSDESAGRHSGGAAAHHADSPVPT